MESKSILADDGLHATGIKPRAQQVRRIAVIGNYLPRKCGIATFTTDLCDALVAEYENLTVFALPINDTQEGYAYPSRVRFEINQDDLASYKRAADFLNLNNIDLVCLQHEFGIFGGPAGSYILELLRDLRMPVVATLHTVLKTPTQEQEAVMEELGHLCDRVVVMSHRGRQFLEEIYEIPDSKVDMIHHGIPDVPFVDAAFYKDNFGVEGKHVILTFGLLSPNKGIETMIDAMPKIVKEYPDTKYICLGATHPHLVRYEGERYREGLEARVRELGIEENVIFVNQFVDLDDLVEYIGAADIYVTPYLNEAQITSGTLAYAAGAGKAVVSTPYWYAQELLADERGLLVPFKDPKAIANAVIELLGNEQERNAMRKRAYMYGRSMTWSTTARRYMRAFVRAREERMTAPRAAYSAHSSRKRNTELPMLNLDHVIRMTDDTGMFQHAIFTIPNYDEGYCTDDNARGLVLTTMLEEAGGERAISLAKDLTVRYLAFLWHAFNQETGRFRNFMSYDRRWLEEQGSDDSHCRALWSLGTVAGRSKYSRMRSIAGKLFSMALPATLEIEHPHSWAFTLVAIHDYMRRFYGDRAAQMAREVLAEQLLAAYKENASDNWPWFEDKVSYSSAKLPHAMLLCGRWMSRPDMTEVGMKSLEWLVQLQHAEEGHFVPIGNKGFFLKGGARARFDQQPIEVHAMVSACLEAFRLTGEERWFDEARTVFDWFLGHNDVNLPLYDPATGGCRDGLHADRTNQNQGAESTLAFLMSLVELRLAEVNVPHRRRDMLLADLPLAPGAAQTPQVVREP